MEKSINPELSKVIEGDHKCCEPTPIIFNKDEKQNTVKENQCINSVPDAEAPVEEDTAVPLQGTSLTIETASLTKEGLRSPLKENSDNDKASRCEEHKSTPSKDTDQNITEDLSSVEKTKSEGTSSQRSDENTCKIKEEICNYKNVASDKISENFSENPNKTKRLPLIELDLNTIIEKGIFKSAKKAENKNDFKQEEQQKNWGQRKRLWKDISTKFESDIDKDNELRHAGKFENIQLSKNVSETSVADEKGSVNVDSSVGKYSRYDAKLPKFLEGIAGNSEVNSPIPKKRAKKMSPSKEEPAGDAKKELETVTSISSEGEIQNKQSEPPQEFVKDTDVKITKNEENSTEINVSSHSEVQKKESSETVQQNDTTDSSEKRKSLPMKRTRNSVQVNNETLNSETSQGPLEKNNDTVEKQLPSHGEKESLEQRHFTTPVKDCTELKAPETSEIRQTNDLSLKEEGDSFKSPAHKKRFQEIVQKLVLHESEQAQSTAFQNEDSDGNETQPPEDNTNDHDGNADSGAAGGGDDGRGNDGNGDNRQNEDLNEEEQEFEEEEEEEEDEKEQDSEASIQSNSVYENGKNIAGGKIPALIHLCQAEGQEVSPVQDVQPVDQQLDNAAVNQLEVQIGNMNIVDNKGSVNTEVSYPIEEKTGDSSEVQYTDDGSAAEHSGQPEYQPTPEGALSTLENPNGAFAQERTVEEHGNGVCENVKNIILDGNTPALINLHQAEGQGGAVALVQPVEQQLGNAAVNQLQVQIGNMNIVDNEQNADDLQNLPPHQPVDQAQLQGNPGQQ